LIKTIAGLEQPLVQELAGMGIEGQVLNRAVSITGDTGTLYKINYCCQTALRVLKPVLTFEIKSQKDFYDRMLLFPWEQFFEADRTIAVDAVISYTVFTNSQFVAQRTKDAIVDRFRHKYKRRPTVDLEDPDIRINVHLFKNQCTVSFDASGSSLHRRGYRLAAGFAPINEVLAAGLVRLTEWDNEQVLLDPMCGSGTLLIEAAMKATRTPAGYYRNRFGFMKWNDFDEEIWNRVKTEADAEKIPLAKDQGIRFYGSDQNNRAILSASRNIEHTGFGRSIFLRRVPFEDARPPAPHGTIIMNPPYDERIRLEDSIAFYKMIGNILKRSFPGWQAWIISSDLEAMKFVGLKPFRKFTVYNGPLECRFAGYSVYHEKKEAGSEKKCRE
jgi:putative N6-adenine-specific DNA methylase